MPGVSRSGITITAGRFLKLDRDSAARLSFFLLIPIVFGAVLYKGLTDVVFGSLPSGSAGPFVVGMIAAAGAGLIAIELLSATCGGTTTRSSSSTASASLRRS